MRARDGYPEDFPVVLDTRTICSQARVHPILGRLCAEPPGAASGGVPPGVECRNCTRCRCAIEPDHGANSDHLWAPRHGDVDSFCGSDDWSHTRLRTADI